MKNDGMPEQRGLDGQDDQPGAGVWRAIKMVESCEGVNSRITWPSLSSHFPSLPTRFGLCSKVCSSGTTYQALSMYAESTISANGTDKEARR